MQDTFCSFERWRGRAIADGAPQLGPISAGNQGTRDCRTHFFHWPLRYAATEVVMTKALLIALGLSLVSFEAVAISRYNSTSMSCAEVRATILAEGAAIMRWRSARGVQRYGRYVASDRFCPSAEIAEWSSIPSADRRSCNVLECKQYSPEDDDFFWLRRRW
jgi:hypothetical protein